MTTTKDIWAEENLETIPPIKKYSKMIDFKLMRKFSGDSSKQ